MGRNLVGEMVTRAADVGGGGAGGEKMGDKAKGRLQARNEMVKIPVRKMFKAFKATPNSKTNTNQKDSTTSSVQHSSH
jgi:hypothetical protein